MLAEGSDSTPSTTWSPKTTKSNSQKCRPQNKTMTIKHVHSSSVQLNRALDAGLAEFCCKQANGRRGHAKSKRRRRDLTCHAGALFGNSSRRCQDTPFSSYQGSVPTVFSEWVWVRPCSPPVDRGRPLFPCLSHSRWLRDELQ